MKKIITAAVIVISVSLLFMGKLNRIFSFGGNTVVTETSSPNSNWVLESKDEQYDWFIPSTSQNGTEWFLIKDLDTKFRSKTDAFWDLKNEEGQIITLINKHREKTFTLNSRELSKEEILSITDKTTTVRFRPKDGQPLTVKIGVRR